MSEHVDLDVVGVLHKPTEDGQDIKIIPGWHVNTTEEVPSWAQWQVFPKSPSQEFFGVETFYYTFESEEAFVAVKAKTGLN